MTIKQEAFSPSVGFDVVFSNLMEDLPMAIHYLKAVESAKDFQYPEMALALRDVLSCFPEHVDVLLPAYVKYLTPAELDGLADLPGISAFLARYRSTLLLLMSSVMAEAS